MYKNFKNKALKTGFTKGEGEERGSVRQSLQKNKKGILFVLCSAIFVCIGQLFWKVSIDLGWLFFILGFVCYGVGAIFMITAYRYGELSVLQPMLSINYVLGIILGVLVLQESLTISKAIGIGIISLGVVLIGGGSSES